MADFMTSTHRAKWIFTPQDLKEKYKDANKRAKQALEKYGATRMEVDIDGSFTYIEAQRDAKNDSEKHSKPKALRTEEEQLMRAFYEFKIQDVCDAFKFPRKIQATALIYFKRFYLQWSVMEHHPKNIMLTCIYAACKAEENHVSAEELGKGIEQDHQMILNNEMLVLQSLGFDLIVYAPYRALDGFINDMEEFYDGKLGIIKNLHEYAKLEADKIMRSDAPLLFPPGQVDYKGFGLLLQNVLVENCERRTAFKKHMHTKKSQSLNQLALAALRRASEFHNFIDVERYLKSMLSRQHPVHNFSDLNLFSNAIDTLINKLETPTSKDVKHIDRKLKSCLDPSSHDKSKKRKHRSKESSTETHGVS